MLFREKWPGAGRRFRVFTYVAAGFYDGFWEMKLNPWDMAAGALMILEAGGLVTGIDGEDSYMDSGAIVAGTPKIFAEMLNTLQLPV